jgi:DNA invertase Pin-like site-specific DNA recombinase
MKQTHDRNMDTVLYIRSNHLESFNLQKLKGEKFAEQHSLSIDIIADTTTSGFKSFSVRPGIQKVLQLVEDRMVKSIIVDTLHRVSRDSKELLNFNELLKANHVELIILDGGIKNGYQQD